MIEISENEKQIGDSLDKKDAEYSIFDAERIEWVHQSYRRLIEKLKTFDPLESKI